MAKFWKSPAATGRSRYSHGNVVGAHSLQQKEPVPTTQLESPWDTPDHLIKQSQDYGFCSLTGSRAA